MMANVSAVAEFSLLLITLAKGHHARLPQRKSEPWKKSVLTATRRHAGQSRMP
jgi:hypothetical protein